MLEPDLIIRTHRRSLCLRITKDAKLIVHAPKRLPLQDIYKYILEKEKWIKTKQKEIEDNLQINKDIIEYNEFLFLGSKFKIKFIKGLQKIELLDNYLCVPEKFNNEYLINKIKQWYISMAKKILKERLEYFANLMQLDYSSLTINNSKSRWGSCDTKQNIKLNFRLILLQHKTIDFVIIHELSHIVEFNHSKDFYKIVSMIMPSYKLQQNNLKKNDYILNLFR